MYYEFENAIISMDNIQYIRYDEEHYANGKGRGIFTVSIYYTNGTTQRFDRVDSAILKDFIKTFKKYVDMD